MPRLGRLGARAMKNREVKVSASNLPHLDQGSQSAIQRMVLLLTAGYEFLPRIILMRRN